MIPAAAPGGDYAGGDRNAVWADGPAGAAAAEAGTLALWGGEQFACRPCYDSRTFADCPRNDCIQVWTAEMVAGRVMTMLEERARGVLSGPKVEVL